MTTASNPATPIRTRSAALAAAITILAAGTAFAADTPAAGWPTGPESSIVVGNAEALFFGPRQTLASTPGQTWFVWQDSVCDGSVRLNRVSRDGSILADGGVVIQPDPTCAFINPPLAAPLGDTLAATRNLSSLDATPLNAFDAQAQPLWNPAFTTADSNTIQLLTALPGGDVLAASAAGPAIRLDRLDAQGQPVWPSPTRINSPTGSNFIIRAAVPDSAGGFYLTWDAPTSYRRLMFVQRFNAAGDPVWAEPINPTPPPPHDGISRHTRPAFAPAADSRLLVVWTDGFEQATTPAPILYQIMNPDGSLAFPIDGRRLADSPRRQFDPIATHDPATGDTWITWRDGQFDETTIRTQRLTGDGERLLSAEGLPIASIEQNAAFDAGLIGHALHVAHVAPGVVLVRGVSPNGTPIGPWPAAANADATSVVLEPAGDALVVSWQQDGPMLEDTIRANRLNRGGRLGPASCNPADLAAPFDTLDLADVQAFAAAFLAGDDLADLGLDAVLDLTDVQAFVAAFSAGCP